MDKIGIEETEKLIFILSSDILQLFSIDFERVIDELEDLDESEKHQLMIDIAKVSLDLMLKISVY